MRRSACRLFLILLLAAITATAHSVHASEATCAAAMERFLKETGNEKFTATLEDLHSLKMPSLREVERIPGQHGGEVIVVERTKDHWASSHTTVAFDLQGDPRWFIQVFTPEVAAFFGYKQLDNKTITMPDIVELKGAIAKVNKVLTAAGHEPINLSFFRSTAENTKVNTYLEKFIRDLEIPLAGDGNHMFHDLSFHAPSITLPRRVLEYGAARYKFILEFTEFLKNKYREDSAKGLEPNQSGNFFTRWFKRKPTSDNRTSNDPPRLAAAKFYSFLLKAKLVTEIDNGTGILAPEFALYLSARESYLKSGHEPPSPTTFLGNSLRRFLGTAWGNPYISHDKSPADILAKNLMDMLAGNDIYFRPSEKLGETKELLGRHTERLTIKEVLRALIEFTAQYKSDNPDFNPLRPVPEGSKFVDQQCLAMTHRRQAIAEATRELAGNQ